MAINLPDFSGIGKTIGGKNTFDGYMNGLNAYLESYKPQLLQGQINQQQEALRAQQLATQLKQSKLPYADEMASLEPQSQRAKLELMLAQAMNQQKQAQQGYKPQSSWQERVAQILNDPNVPEHEKETYAQLSGVNLPGSQDNISNYPKNVQGKFVEANREYLKQAEGAEKTVHILGKMKKLVKAHPKMGEYFSAALLQKDPGLLDQLKRKFIGDEEALTAIQQMDKLGNELAQQMVASFGGRASDARLAAAQASKPHFTNTEAANEAIINHLEQEALPLAKRKKDILAKQKAYKIYHPDEENPYEKDFVRALSEGSSTQGGQQVFVLNGQRYNIPEEMVAEFLEANPGAKRNG